MLTVVISLAIGGDPYDRLVLGTVDVDGDDLEPDDDSLAPIVRSVGRKAVGENLEERLRVGLPWWNGYVVVDLLRLEGGE